MAETIRLNNLDNEFQFNAEANALDVIDQHLRAIAGRIRSIANANTEKDIEDQLKSIDELNNGTYLLRQLLQNVQPSSNTYELEYVDREVFGADKPGVATRRGVDVEGGILGSLTFPADQVILIKKKLVAYGLKTDIFDIPLIRLLRQDYTFSDFDLAVTALVKQKLLNKDPVRIFNLKGPEGEISEGVFETLGLTDPDDFPDASLDNDLNEEFIEQYIRDSLINSDAMIDPGDTADGFLGKLSNFFNFYTSAAAERGREGGQARPTQGPAAACVCARPRRLREACRVARGAVSVVMTTVTKLAMSLQGRSTQVRKRLHCHSLSDAQHGDFHCHGRGLQEAER